MNSPSSERIIENGECRSTKAAENGSGIVFGTFGLEAYNANERQNVINWLNSLFSHLKLPPEASDEDLRASLLDGSVLIGILNRLSPGSVDEQSEGHLEKINKFIAAMDLMGLPVFELSDLQQGSMTTVLESLSVLKGQFSSDIKGDISRANNLRRKWRFLDTVNTEGEYDFLGDQPYGSISPRIGHISPRVGPMSPGAMEDRRRAFSEMKSERAQRGPVMSEPSMAVLHHGGHKFHDVFQLKQGRYSDLPQAKISEMLKSTSLDNAPTQSLLSVVNGILDESMDKKNGEIPYRVACLLRKVVQEIERRISTQAEHIRNQNNLIKARDQKYQSRIKLLETLANGTDEEAQNFMSQLQQIKTEKIQIEESKKLGEQDVVRLTKEKENSDLAIADLKKELEITKKMYEDRCLLLTTEATETKVKLEEKIKEIEQSLAELSKKNQELEAFSESKAQLWNDKKHSYKDFINFQFQVLQDLRVATASAKKEILVAQTMWRDQFKELGVELQGLANAAQNYHLILAENRKLYNEVQDLKGNIRVFCRIKPFLSGQNKKQSVVQYIGEDGELLVVNPSKQGKEGHRTFKFDKVFGPTTSQEEVFLNTQPLIRCVLDGFNVCIFAYGQTGSGKTYTMSGPDGASKEQWGVNNRALNDLFAISDNRSSSIAYEVSVQMIEIYNEQVRDLLISDGSEKKLGIWNASLANGLAVPDASMHPVTSTEEVLQIMEIGLRNRAVGATALNMRSSRSHSILTVHVGGSDLKTGAALRGSLHLVDLAGSERIDRSEATGDRLKEAQHINKSLSALGDVIFSLAHKNAHIPYRNSKLTQVLQTSLGGRAKTLMLVQVNPEVDSYSETLSTLKFAERVSGVELGAARSNKEGKDVKDLMDQVTSLKDIIARKDEEIVQLQHLKNLKVMSPNSANVKRVVSSLRPSVGGSPNRTQRLPGGRSLGTVEKVSSDIGHSETSSEYNDKHSETSSQLSTDDSRHQKEFVAQKNLIDAEFVGLGDANSEGRLSDISDSVLSIGTETDSISSGVEVVLDPEGAETEENIDKAQVSVKLTQRPKVRQVSSSRLVPKDSPRALVKDAIKVSANLRKSTRNYPAVSIAKNTKRWQ